MNTVLVKMERFWIRILTLMIFHHLNLTFYVKGEDYLPTSHFLNPVAHDGPPTCEPIKIGLCMGVGYNETIVPNMVGHDGQMDADAVLQTFAPLIQYGCSAQLKLLLCSAFVPMCTEKVPQPIGPCRDLCLSVKGKCEPIMVEFGFSWPASLDCNLFHPENNHQNMCIPGLDPPSSATGTGTGSGKGVSTSHYGSSSGSSSGFGTGSGPGSGSMSYPTSRQKGHDSKGGFDRSGGMDKSSMGKTPFDSPSLGFGHATGGGFFSPGTPNSVLLDNSNHNHHLPGSKNSDINFHEDGLHHHPLLINHRGNGGNGPNILGGNLGSSSTAGGGGGGVDCGLKIARKGECWIPCDVRGRVTSTGTTAVLHQGIHQGGPSGFPTHGGFFFQHEQDFGRRYAFIWAVLSLVGAVIAVFLATTLARTLSSPAERPVVYIGLCQIFYSVGVIIGSANGSGSGHGPCVYDKLTGIELMARSSLVPPSCSLVFLLTYFFGIASSLWWVMLCLSWLLSLNKSFGNSLESREWSMYHLFTWATASVLTCTVLLRKNVDSDELTGVCGVGFQENPPFLYFMVIPFAACLGNGLGLLLTGCLLRYRVRYQKKARYGRRNGGTVGDYEVVSSSLGPSFTNLQQKRLNEKSKTTWNRVLIFALVHLIPVFTHVGTLLYEYHSRSSWTNQQSRPNLQLFLLKVNMNLIPGLTTGIWILSIYSWKSWFLKLFSCAFPSRLDCNKLIQQTVINFSSGSSSSAHSNNRRHNTIQTPSSVIPSLNALAITDPATAALNPFHSANGTSTFHPGARSLPPIPNSNLNLNSNSNSTSIPNSIQTQNSNGIHHTHTHHTHGHNHQHQHHGDSNVNVNHGFGMRTETWHRDETIV